MLACAPALPSLTRERGSYVTWNLCETGLCELKTARRILQIHSLTSAEALHGQWRAQLSIFSACTKDLWSGWIVPPRLASNLAHKSLKRYVWTWRNFHPFSFSIHFFKRRRWAQDLAQWLNITGRKCYLLRNTTVRNSCLDTRGI